MVRHIRRYLEDREPSEWIAWAALAVVGVAWILSMVMLGWPAFLLGLKVAVPVLVLTAILFLTAHLKQRE